MSINMEPDSVVENVPNNEDIAPTEESNYIEIEIPYTLFQFLSTENCDVQNICRICLVTNSEVLYPLASTKENSFLADIVTTLTNVRLLPDDGLPTSICELCQNLVLQYYEFKLKCEKSDCMLRSILKGEFVVKEESSNLSIPVKYEVATVDNKETSDVKDEELVQDVQYLEDPHDDDVDADDNLLIIPKNKQANSKRKKKKNVKSNAAKCVQNEDIPEKLQPEKRTKSFACNLCPKMFLKPKTLRQHVRNKHGIITEKRPYPCGQCKQSFDSEHDLTVHSAIHSKGAFWKCNQCQKEFNSKATFRRHIQRHMEFKRHPCEICGKTFTELYALRRHVRVHTGERVEKKHVCHICDKRYTDSGLLAAHVARHAGLRPCECGACGKRFATTRLLHSHMRVHTDRKPFACAFCDKRFRHESTRNTHHRTHTGEKPYVCSVCGKNFIQNSNLTLHMRTHTGERPYSCKMCDRKFSSGSSLKSHERIHTGERPYSCNVCGKRFARMNLGAHMRQHTGERPFACSACPKKFINSSRLRDHCRIHTGEKPYECAYCTFTFATKSHLVKHMKSHDPPKKKTSKRNVLLVQQIPCEPLIMTDNTYKEDNGVIVNENTAIIEAANDAEKNITLVQEVPLEVTGELILQDDNNMKADLLIVGDGQNSYQINNDSICLNADNMNIINGENYSGDMNLVTVNEGGVSISASSLEGTTVKLYQLDQSLLQIHSSGGQVTISKITSKMTANF